jgi:Hydrazine synthase alpha subunit middle domain
MREPLKWLIGAAILLAGPGCAAAAKLPGYVFTSARRFEPQVWMEGRERFPAGAALVLVSGPDRRTLFPDFFASADAAISSDGRQVLFAGKRTASAHWQIWEAPLAGGTPHALTPADADCIRPVYLPDGRAVYTRLRAMGSELEAIPLAGGPTARLSFAPGWYLTADVLRDGRILFETAGELFTVYPDGTGVEALRCDHGPTRGGARQISSGDVVFTAGARLARFTSTLAGQVEIPQPALDFLGPVAEIAPDSWIVALRRRPSATFGLFLWTPGSRKPIELEVPAGGNAVEPAIVAPRTPPPQFPSALVPTRTAGNLLCLNARAGKQPISAAVRAVRAYTQAAGGAPSLLGQAPVERDGSFYIQVPADRPLRLELLDEKGAVVRAERNWFWMRPSEQRVCVGCHAGPERAPENKVPEVLLRTIVPEKLLGPQS